MPTPVSTARQLLTEEAARALDDAVIVALRRSHSQTSSIHAVSALLAPPSSTLREACARSRSSAYTPRLQFHALELAVGVSLDRLATSRGVEDPPVSNSLMAAIKRSQANQRRHPETFHLYQQLQVQSSQSSISCVKVELKHFILSILDDPIVSRIFGDAGFRSSEIKLAILQPPIISRFPRARCPPLFLCNLPGSESNPVNFNFPFAGHEDGGENRRRIGEVLAGKKGKNPLLIGVCANDALSSFKDCVRRRKTGLLPSEIDGLGLICIEKEISCGGKEMVDLKFKEVADLVENCSGPGILVSVGELKVLLGDGGSVEPRNYVVSKLSRLLDVHVGKLWLIGAVGSYETYMKILAPFPSIEKDWDMQLLPIISSKPSSGGLCSKPSLMGSFVPFAGFFPSPSEVQNLLSNTNRSTRCDLCNEKYEHEAYVLLKGGPAASVADQFSVTVSPLLHSHMAECDERKRVDIVKEAKDDVSVLNAKLMGLQRKWNDICQSLHPIRQPFSSDISPNRVQTQNFEEFQFAAERNGSSCKDLSQNESGSSSLISSIPVDPREVSPVKQAAASPVSSEAQNANFQARLLVEASITNVTTDLGLGTPYLFSGQDARNFKFEDHRSRLHFPTGSVPAESNGVSEDASNYIAHRSLGGEMHAKHFKSVWRVLTEKVRRQGEAIFAVSHTVSHCRTGNGRLRGSNHRGDIWLSLVGDDKVAKKRTATALAEIIFGSRESLMCVNLSSEDGMSGSNSIFDRRNLNRCDVRFRRKTVVDYIAEGLSRKPQSVVFLENLDKADFLAQTSLSQAIRTGRFPDSHGREIGINNAIFVTTINPKKNKKEIISVKGYVQFSEERIQEAKGLQMQLLVGCVAGNVAKTKGINVSIMLRKETSKPSFVNKRKLIDVNELAEQDRTLEIPKRAHKASESCLDLNLPVVEEEVEEESNSISEESDVWLEDFLSQVDGSMVFDPFDFDALADELLKEIDRIFKKTVGSETMLQIDEEAMVEMLAAAWLSERNRTVEDWVEHVLGRSFAETHERYHLTSQNVLKLVACEGLFLEEEASGVALPTRIILK